MLPDAIHRALAETRDFIGVGVAVCTLADAHNLSCAVFLLSPTGRPMLMVDNAVLADDHRRWWVSEQWIADPHFAHVRAHHAAAGHEVMSARRMHVIARAHGYTGPVVHSVSLPILQPGGLLGILRLGKAAPIDPDLRRRLGVLAHYVSVRLAGLGVTTADIAPSRLTPRQCDVAELAVQGRTTPEIADALALSANTVKKHLKEVFSRMEVSNRIALGAHPAMRRVALDVPVGVTRRDGITITRGG